MTESKPNKKGRKRILDQKMVDTITRIISKTGSDREAYEAAGISHASYYQWLKDNEDFRTQCDRAKQEYQDSLKDVVDQRIQLAEDYITRLLKGTVTKSKTLVFHNERGQVTGSQTSEEDVLPPKWVLERFLPAIEQDSTITVNVNFSDDEPV